MKAMQVEGDWGVDNIRLADRPEPEPAAHEVTVDIKAVSINPRDYVMVNGGYGKRGGEVPLVPLCDGAGVISAVGEQVTDYAVGDRVVCAYSRTWLTGTFKSESFSGAHGGPLDGMMQEKVTIPANAIVPVPEQLTLTEVATLPCAGVTAWNALIEQGRLAEGDAILLQGTGGVSLFALGIAKMVGATVIITSSSDEKLERARALGADHTINYREVPDWHNAARNFLGGRGVDHIIEIGGTKTLDQSLRAIEPSGVISLIGILSGAHAELNLARVVTRNVRMQGVTVGSREMLAQLVSAIVKHDVHPVIDRDNAFAFDDVAAALKGQSAGRHFGKITCEF